MQSVSIHRVFLFVVSLVIAASALAQSRETYKDPKAPLNVRVQDLLARMTVEEKVAQMQSMWAGKAGILNADGTFSAEKARTALTNGIGQIGRPTDFMGTPRFVKERFRSIDETTAFVNATQRFLIEQTRLGIPALELTSSKRL